MDSSSSEGDGDDAVEVEEPGNPGSSDVAESKQKVVFPIFQKDFKPKDKDKLDPLRSIQLEIEKKNKTKKKRMKNLLSRKETPGLTQSVIDAGQKEIGPKICAECGLLYSPGDFEDEEEHRKAHLKLDNLYSFRIWKDMKILSRFLDGSYIIVIRPKEDSKKITKRFIDFLQWIDSELGIGYNPDDGYKNGDRIFFYVFPTKRKETVRILGIVGTELIYQSKVNSFSLNESNGHEPHKITIGITKIWTDAMFRKKKIATRLCDIARFNSGIPNYVLPKSELGILEPTEDGRAFMNKYTKMTGAFYSYGDLLSTTLNK